MDVTGVRWQDRAHFFAISAQIMRRILVDAARARGSRKRGGGAVRLDLNESIDALPELDSRLVDLDEALESLARFDARKVKVVELRFFGGLSVKETARGAEDLPGKRQARLEIRPRLANARAVSVERR